MKIFISLFLFYFFLASCSFPTYTIDKKSPSIGLDFTKGKWLLNKIEAPVDIKSQLTKIALHDFKCLNDNVIYTDDINGLLLPKNIGLNPDRTILEILKNGTGYDFFINIKATVIRKDFGAIDLTPHRLNSGGKNQSKVTIEVYDLNIQEVIYSKEVLATVERQIDNQDVHLSKSSSSLILGGYKKLFKEIRQKSITRK